MQTTLEPAVAHKGSESHLHAWAANSEAEGDEEIEQVRDAVVAVNRPEQSASGSDERGVATRARDRDKLHELDMEDSNRMYASRTRLRKANLVLVTAALLGLFFGMVEMEVFHLQREQTAVTEALKIIIDLLSLVAAVALYYSYTINVTILKLRNRALPEDNMWTLGMGPLFLLELVVLAAQPYPFVSNVTARLSTNKCLSLPLMDMIPVVLWLRVYHLLRPFHDYFWRHQMSHFYSALNGIELDLGFTAKAALSHRPFSITLVCFLLTFFSGAHILWALERNCPGTQVTGFADALWLMYASMTTVGYGDVVPVSPFTRIVIALAIGASVFITAMLQTVMISSLNFSTVERRFVDLVKRSHWRRRVRDESARAIQQCWRAYVRSRRAEAAVAAPPAPAQASERPAARRRLAIKLGKTASRYQHRIALHLRGIRKRAERRMQTEPDIQSLMASLHDRLGLSFTHAVHYLRSGVESPSAARRAAAAHDAERRGDAGPPPPSAPPRPRPVQQRTGSDMHWAARAALRGPARHTKADFLDELADLKKEGVPLRVDPALLGARAAPVSRPRTSARPLTTRAASSAVTPTPGALGGSERGDSPVNGHFPPHPHKAAAESVERRLASLEQEVARSNRLLTALLEAVGGEARAKGFRKPLELP